MNIGLLGASGNKAFFLKLINKWIKMKNHGLIASRVESEALKIKIINVDYDWGTGFLG